MDAHDVIRRYSQKRDAGMDVDTAISQLRRGGVTITEAIKVIRRVYGVDLGEAKQLVAGHDSWKDISQPWDEIHEELIRAMAEMTEPVEEE